MQVRLFPSEMAWKSPRRLDDCTVFWSSTKGAGLGVVSVVLQLGPREPMNDVLPTSVFPVTVKFTADEIAIP